MTGSWLWQRRLEEPRALDALLGDVDTVDTAESVFAALGRPDATWWPCAAAVGAQTVTVRLAGLGIPEPEAPWHAGHGPQVWTAQRGELTRTRPDGPGLLDRGRLLLVGCHQDSVVFIDTTRASGPLEVIGDSEQAERVRGLIDGQSRDRVAAAGGAHWPVEVGDGIVVVIGLPVAAVLSEPDTKLAAELMLRAAERIPPQDAAPEPREPDRDALEDWMRQVREATTARDKAPAPALAPAPEPADDWMAQCAVSSAETVTAH
jgi:hypothetical protein